MRPLRPLATAFGFLSRLPVGHSGIEPADLGRSIGWFPVVGLAFGLLLAGAALLLQHRVPSSLLAVGLVALLALLSGGLHLDGLADVFDGLGGGRGDRERTLAIMRDSHIGAHGAAALVVVVAAKIAAVEEVLRTDALWALACAPLLARWAVVPLVVCFPYARPQGLGRALADHGRFPQLVLATVLAAPCVVACGSRALAPSASALLAALALALLLWRRIDGLTGDGYGAAIELAELAFLATASLQRGP